MRAPQILGCNRYCFNFPGLASFRREQKTSLFIDDDCLSMSEVDVFTFFRIGLLNSDDKNWNGFALSSPMGHQRPSQSEHRLLHVGRPAIPLWNGWVPREAHASYEMWMHRPRKACVQSMCRQRDPCWVHHREGVFLLDLPTSSGPNSSKKWRRVWPLRTLSCTFGRRRNPRNTKSYDQFPILYDGLFLLRSFIFVFH